jgi:hypothetical protein
MASVPRDITVAPQCRVDGCILVDVVFVGESVAWTTTPVSLGSPHCSMLEDIFFHVIAEGRDGQAIVGAGGGDWERLRAYYLLAAACRVSL